LHERFEAPEKSMLPARRERLRLGEAGAEHDEGGREASEDEGELLLEGQ